MLRRHNVTLEYDEFQDIYILNVDGYLINLTYDDMNKLGLLIEKENEIKAIEGVAEYMKQQDLTLYNTKLVPLGDNPNAADIYEVIKCQITKPVFTQKPSE